MVAASRLHDPCLVALFKQLPPADQMTARTVCRRWADLVTYAARSTRSLAILVGDQDMDVFETNLNMGSLGSINVVSLLKKEDGSPMFPLERFSQWNALHYRGGLDEATVEAIVDTFVNIKTLLIGLHDDVPWSQFDFFSYLLELWHHQLTTLKVYENLGYPEDRSPNHFFAAINGLTTVKYLRLDLRFLPYHDMPIISQLEHLRIYWAEMTARQFASMLQDHLNHNTSLEYFPYEPISAMLHFTSLGDHLLSRFTHFGFPWSPFINSELICTHFRHLISLSLEPTDTDLTLRRLLGHLSQLTQLLHLRLIINFPSLLPDDQPHLLLPQLKSVKALQLDLTIHSHRELEQMKISWTMPNLQAIDIRHIWQSKCTDCTIEDFGSRYIEASLAPYKHCLRQMLAPLKANCTNLRAILHDREATFGTAEELLAE